MKGYKGKKLLQIESAYRIRHDDTGERTNGGHLNNAQIQIESPLILQYKRKEKWFSGKE